MWLQVRLPSRSDVTYTSSWQKDDWFCSGEGWSELFVAELPEPDDTERTSIGVERIKFGPITATLNPDHTSSISNEVCLWDADTARTTAHALLAAVAVCERHRETT